jgi:hypothetical protein
MSEAQTEKYRAKEVAPRSFRITNTKKGAATVGEIGKHGTARTLTSGPRPRVAPKHGVSARGPPSAKKYVTVAMLRARYADVSAMWVERRLKDDPSFPRPIFFGRLRFFDLSEIERWEQAQILKSSGAS